MPAEGWRVGAAALPLAILLVGLLGLHWRGTQAGIIALAVSAAVAAIAFAASPAVLGIALWRAIALSLHVLYIIWAALLLYEIADKIGAIRSIGTAIAHLTEDHVLQLLIVGVAFTSFLQGVAGFGVPVAVTAPLLIGLGFQPLEAAAVPLVGHAWAVTMGDMASSFQALRAVTGLSRRQLGTWMAALRGSASVATFIPPLNRLLDAVAVSFHFGTAQTGLGRTTESGAFHIPVFGHPGALLLYTSVLAVLLYRVAGRTVPDWRRLWRQVAVQGVPTTMTIITLVGVATVMAYSGMTFVLARGLTAAVGPLFPLLSPFLGLVGTVITGSNTNSNVLFGALQRDAARLLQMNPVLMAALQTAGGALGSMVAPAKVVLATATTGLAGREGPVIRITARYALLLAALMGFIGMLLQR